MEQTGNPVPGIGAASSSSILPVAIRSHWFGGESPDGNTTRKPRTDSRSMGQAGAAFHPVDRQRNGQDVYGKILSEADDGYRRPVPVDASFLLGEAGNGSRAQEALLLPLQLVVDERDLPFLQGILALAGSPVGFEAQLERPFLRPAQGLGQGPGPGGRLRIEIGQNRSPPPADEPAHPFRIPGGFGPHVRQRVPPDGRLHIVCQAEQLFLVPDRVEQLLQAGGVVRPRRLPAVQTVGDGPVRQNRSRRLEIVERDIGRGENLVGAPGNELEGTVRLAVDEVVVAVAGVPVPVAGSAPRRPRR